MRNHNRLYQFIVFSTIPLFLLIGCNKKEDLFFTSSTSSLNLVESTTISTPTRTQTIRIFTSPTNPTFTPSPISTTNDSHSHMGTITPSPFQLTWTQLPTLSTTEAEIYTSELFDTNAGCRLPCWWGIIPGQTTWQRAKYFLESFTILHVKENFGDSVFIAEFSIPVSKEINEYYFTHHYKVQNGIVDTIEVFTGYIQNYSLVSIIDRYGLPEELWIRTWSSEFSGNLPFSITLFYPSQGFIAFYTVNAELVGDIVQTCFRDVTRPVIGLWSPDREMSYIEAQKAFRQYFEEFPELPVEEATSMDIETFYKAILDTNICIQSPAELWPPQ